jgi:hypothetical protein
MAATLAVLVAAAVGCGPRRPTVYLGEHPTAASETKAEGDIDACMEVGTRYRSPGHGGGAVARNTAVGGTVGAAAGAAGGAIWGNAGRGAATGAAAGAAGALVGTLLRRPPPDPAYQAAVEQCLADRGLRVLTWD